MLLIVVLAVSCLMFAPLVFYMDSKKEAIGSSSIKSVVQGMYI